MDKPAFKQLVKRPPVDSLRATGGCTLEIHRQVLKGRLRGQRADASTGHAEAFAADSCADLLVFLLDMNNALFVIDSIFISLSLIKGAYHNAGLPVCYVLLLRFHMLHGGVYQFQLLLRGTGQLLDGFQRLLGLELCQLLPKLLLRLL